MAQAYFPQQAGGMQVVARDRARAMQQRGHVSAIASALSFRGATGLRAGLNYLRGSFPISHEVRDGLDLFRVRSIIWRSGAVLDAFAPDVVLLASMDARQIALEVSRRRIPLVVSFHDAETRRWGGTDEGIVARFVSNSSYTARVYEQTFGIRSTIIPPPIRAEAYAVPRGQGQNITLVNPVVEKGLPVALALAAACPELTFEFVLSWVLRRHELRTLKAQIRPFPNIRLTPMQTDMRAVYARCRVLLAPSRWSEGWGRVASEAQVSGIPVLASTVGGLPDAVGPGGVVLPPDAPAADWVAALRRMLEPAEYARLSGAALTYAARPDFTFDCGVNRIMAELDAAMKMRSERATCATEPVPQS